MKKCFLLCPLIILAAVFSVYYFGVLNSQKQWPKNNQQAERQESGGLQKQWETKIDGQQPVTIKVTPVEFGGDYKIWKFIIVLDTHSGSLNEDLVEVAVLLDNKGNTYRPVAWKGSASGGHHREGILTFNAISPMPEYIELKIKNVGGVLERSFIW